MTQKAIIIGSTTISTDMALSNLAGCELWAHPEDEPLFLPVIGSDKAATLKFRVVVQAPSPLTDDDLQTRLDALLAVLTDVRGKTIKLEYAPTKTRFQLPVASSSSFRAESTVMPHAKGAVVDVVLTSDSLTAPETGGPADALGVLRWTIDGTSSGIFVATGLVLFATKTAAEAYVTLLKSGTMPAWMGAKFRYFDHSIKESETGGTPADPAAELTVQMRQWPDEFLALATLSGAVFVDYRSAVKSHGPVNYYAGMLPSNNVLIAGTIIWKVHKLAALVGVGDALMSPNAIRAATTAAIDSLIADFKVRSQKEFDELDREVNAGVRDGEQIFQVRGIELGGSSPIFDWKESVILRFAGGRRYGGDYKGITKRFDHPAGVEFSLVHRIDAQGLAPFAYRPPVIPGSGEWDPENGEIPKAEPDLYPSGTVIYSMNSQVVYKRVITDEGQVKAPFGLDADVDFESLLA